MNLNEQLEKKFPYLKPIVQRNPTSPLYNGLNKVQSLNKRFSDTGEANFFFTWIDKDIDHLNGRMYITCYGVCEFGNVARIQIDDIKPYFYVSFPFHLFDPEFRETLRNDMSAVDIDLMKMVIECEIRTFGFLKPKSRKFDTRKINRMRKFAASYGYPEGTLIVDMRIEWHLEGVGTNLDEPQPFIRITPLLPELMFKILHVLRTTGSRWVYNNIEDEKEAARKKSKKKKQVEDDPAPDDGEEEEMTFDQLMEAYYAEQDCDMIETRMEGDKEMIKKPSWLERLNVPHRNPIQSEFESPWKTWEMSDSMTMIFLKDVKLKPCQWWTIRHITDWEFYPQLFNTAINIECTSVSLSQISDANPIARVFPDDVVFLFDGEMLARGKAFVKARSGDPIGQLGIHIIRTNSLLKKMTLAEMCNKQMMYSLLLSALPVPHFSSVHSNENNKYNIRSLNFSQGDVKRIDFRDEDGDEKNMLYAFCDIFTYTNPSFGFAYNGNRFDIPYIIDRLYILTKCPEKFNRPMFDYNISDYVCLTRDFRSNRGILHQPARQVTAEQSKRASARVAYDKVTITGVANIDLYLYVKQFAKYGLRGFSLDAVAFKRLGERKVEIHYDFIPILFQTVEGRLSIAKYCNRDVELMTRLLSVLGAMEFIYSLSQMTSVTPQMLVDRGTQHLVDGVWYTTKGTYDHISLYPEEKGIRNAVQGEFNAFKDKYFPMQTTPCTFLLPSGYHYIKDIEGPRSKSGNEKGGGADVIEPPNGKTSNTGTLDFASLYPSIMRTFNTCSTTIIPFIKRLDMVVKVKAFRDRFGIDKNEALCQRKESWFCTGNAPKPYATLQAALDFLRSDQCNWEPEMKKAMHKIANKLFTDANLETIAKWEPIALSQYDKIDENAYTDEDKTDKALHDIYLTIVEPICQLTGATKVQYKNKELPIFIGKGIRKGVFPSRQEELAQMRRAVKNDMGNAQKELDRLLRQGVDKTDERIVSLKADISMYDIIQNAIKCIMNSIYGYLASKYLLKMALQETVCVFGQMLLENTKCFLDTMGKKCLGFIGNFVVGYGDTDSCFFIIRLIKYFYERKALLARIRKVFDHKDDTLFDEDHFKDMTDHYSKELNLLVEKGVLDEKMMSKALLLVQWKFVFEDVYHRRNWINALRCDENDDISEIEMTSLDSLNVWFNGLFAKLNVNIHDISNSKWTNIERGAPEPPLFNNKKTPSPRDFRMLLRWLFVNILFDHGKRAERVVNMIFMTKYNGVIMQELEKMYEEIIWWRKKKYAGCMWMPNASAPGIKATGIDAVRGDCTPFKASISKGMLEYMLEEDDDEAAKQAGYRALKRVIGGKIGSSDIIQSKTFKRPAMEYGTQKTYTQVSRVDGELQFNRVPARERKLQIRKGMPVHVVGAIYRHLTYGEQMPEVDERYYFIVLPDVGNVPIGKRVVPPGIVLKSGGLIQYDRRYYAQACVKQIANMLSPLFDTRPFERKMEQAEAWRRIKDKNERNDLIAAYSKSQRDELEKHFSSYAEKGTRMRDQQHMISQNKKLLQGARSHDIRKFFGPGFVQPASSSHAPIEDVEDRIRLLVNRLEDSVEQLIITVDEEDEANRKKFSVNEIIDNIDDYSRMVPFRIDDTIKEDDDEDPDDVMFFRDKKTRKCGVCLRTVRNAKNGCSHCKTKSISTNGQEFITKFTRFDKIRCVLCETVSEKTICDKCRGPFAERKMRAVKQEIIRRQIQEDCAKCATCAGVQAPKMPNVPDVNTSKRTRLEDDTSDETQLPDIEDMYDTVEVFLKKNHIIANCYVPTCPNRWQRAANDRRLDMIRLIEYDYFPGLESIEDDTEVIEVKRHRKQ